MIEITTIVYNLDKALEFEWLISEIDTAVFELSFILVGSKQETHLKKHCEANNVSFYFVPYHSKKDLISATFKTRKILKVIKPDIVHSHIFEGGLVGVTAAWLAGIKNRIYTRHYSDFHHVYFPNGLKYDKWINSKATHIVAVSEMVKNILVHKEGVKDQKVSVIHHGIKMDEKQGYSIQDRVEEVKRKHRIPSDKIVIGVVSRYTFLKGLQHIIPAFKELQKENPNLHLVLANARGDYKIEVGTWLNDLPKDSYTEIAFETDNEALFKCFDIFVHVPISAEAEAFGQIYLEAFKFGIPMVCTLSGVANEIVKNEVNALVVGYESTEEITTALKKLLKDEILISRLVQNGKEMAETFRTIKKTKALEKLYLRMAKKDV